MHYFILYIIGVNILSLILMYIDKDRARKNQYRIRERTLWSVAIFGGAMGATIGMNAFRHKTKHNSFKIGLPILSIIQIVLIVYGYSFLS